MIRIAGLDSGKHRDQSCLVSILVDQENHIAHVEGCRFWPLKTDYTQIEYDIERYHIQAPFKNLMVEVNGIGEHVYESLRRRGVPVRPVTTVHKLAGDRINKNKSQRLRRVMPKNEMVLSYLKLQKEHKVRWPPKKDKNMQQLTRQLAAFSEKKTDSGNVVYQAPGQEHDDGVMSLLMALYEARPLLTSAGISHVGGPAYPQPTDTYSLVRQYQLEGWRQIA